MNDTIDAKVFNRYRNKSIQALLKIAVRHFHRWIRERDAGDGGFECNACGQWKPLDQMQAGHFMAAGNFAPTRFDERNVWACCIKCNHYLSGNLIEYRRRLVEKLGEDVVHEIEQKAHQRGFRWDKTSLVLTILKYMPK